jgi:hypothetical protein
MRFYDPDDPNPSPLNAEELFPNCPLEEAARRCLIMGLVPSVTTILKVLREEYLERWKMREAIAAFIRSGNTWGAVDSVYKAEGKEASFGVKVHKQIEAMAKNKPVDTQSQAWKYAIPLARWLKKNTKEFVCVETVLACRETGTAGTIDLAITEMDGTKTLGDIKVVKYRRKYHLNPPLAYKAQLAAYERMLLIHKGWQADARKSFYLASPFGDLTEPKLTIFAWEKPAWNAFAAARTLWYAQFGLERETPKGWEQEE